MKKIITFLMFFMAFSLFAQEEEKEEKKSFTLSGSIDAYFQTYVTAPDDAGATFGTAFAEKTGFALGMGNLIASYESGKVGAVLDLVVGPRGE